MLCSYSTIVLALTIVNTLADMRYSLVVPLVALFTSSLATARVAPLLEVDDLFKSKADPYSTFIDHCMSRTLPSAANIQSHQTLPTRRSTCSRK
jgi:hypothetical protein